MQIAFWHGGIFPQRSWEMMLKLVNEAQGLIVLPLTRKEVEFARKISGNEARWKLTMNSGERMMSTSLAASLFAQGKTVIPLYSDSYLKTMKTALGHAKNLECLPKDVDAGAFMKDQIISAEAKRLIDEHGRLRKTHPTVVIAEESQARVLAGMMRIKPVPLSGPHPRKPRHARTFAKNVLGRAAQIWKKNGQTSVMENS